ncbi:hypothetical protein OCE55_27800 [Bacillus paranthracis]|nr:MULTISPECIES: hypothetical protein [Bacillus cereus group]MCU5391802.1 hypothetical protein [Bacillus paranthracis]
MKFKELIKYIEENKEKQFDEIIKNNENVIKEIDTKSAKEN